MPTIQRMTGSRLRAAKAMGSHGNPRLWFLQTKLAYRQLALGRRQGGVGPVRTKHRARASQSGRPESSWAETRRQPHVWRCSERAGGPGRVRPWIPWNLCPTQQTAVLGQTHLTGSSGIWAPERTWVCLLELARGLSVPHTRSCTPEPEDVLYDV